jgi:uncharacterized protein YutE (UPF0331/DUF86 family)
MPYTRRNMGEMCVNQSLITSLLADLVDSALVTNLKAMVGFRNIAVHDYQPVNLSILKTIIEKHLQDFSAFAKIILLCTRYTNNSENYIL